MVLAKIKYVVTDCDGVLTDGKYYYSEDCKRLVTYHTNDSLAIELFKKKGIRCIMISSGHSFPMHQAKAREWDIEFHRSPAFKKLETLSELVNLEEVAYVGDSLDDVPVFGKVRLSFAPQNALDVVREAADHVLSRRSGEGCLLEILVMMERLDG